MEKKSENSRKKAEIGRLFIDFRLRELLHVIFLEILKHFSGKPFKKFSLFYKKSSGWQNHFTKIIRNFMKEKSFPYNFISVSSH